MASKYEEFHAGTVYSPCGCCYGERGYFEGNLLSFTRKNKDSATVTLLAKTGVERQNVAWAGNGYRYLWQETWVDGNCLGRSTGTQHDNCSASWGNNITHSGNYSFTQTSANRNEVHIYGRAGLQTRTGESVWWFSENGWSDLVVSLPNSYKVLPPQGLTGRVDAKAWNTVTASCSLNSWSANPNIGGTPYAAGGGRSWNFSAKLLDGSKTLANLTTNTGETRSATFVFKGLNLPLDKTLTVEFTASNNYQLTISTKAEFKVQPIGVIVEPQGEIKKIKYAEIIPMPELQQPNTIVKRIQEIK